MKKLIFSLLILSNWLALAMEPDELQRPLTEQQARGLAALQEYWHEVIDIPLMHRAAELEEQEARNQINKDLIEAAYDNDIELARALIAAGADVHFQRDGEYPLTAFNHAAREGHLEICQLLIDSGIDINQTGSCDSYTPSALFLARDEKTGKFFLERGADIKIKVRNGFSALHHAAQIGSAELCELYIQAGADVHWVNSYGVYPLGIASKSDRATSEFLANKMLATASQEQKPRIYAFLFCLKKLSAQRPLLYNIDLRKLLVRTAIKDENLSLVNKQIAMRLDCMH